jgi:hypothetical protein
MRHIRSHLTYANVMVTILAFIVLTGGTAVALGGTDTVQSDDLGPGSQVKAPDVAANAVTGTDVVDNSISGADVNESSLKGVGGGFVLSRIEDLGGAGTAFGTPEGVAPAHSTELPVEMHVPSLLHQVKATNLQVVLSDDLSEPPDTTQTFTLRADGGDTALSCTINSGIHGCNTPYNTLVNLPNAADLSIKAVSTGTPSPTVDALVGFRLVQ